MGVSEEVCYLSERRYCLDSLIFACGGSFEARGTWSFTVSSHRIFKARSAHYCPHYPLLVTPHSLSARLCCSVGHGVVYLSGGHADDQGGGSH